MVAFIYIGSGAGFIGPTWSRLSVGLRGGLGRLDRDLPLQVIAHPRVHTKSLIHNFALGHQLLTDPRMVLRVQDADHSLQCKIRGMIYNMGHATGTLMVFQFNVYLYFELWTLL